jgi:hypothetical protein
MCILSFINIRWQKIEILGSKVLTETLCTYMYVDNPKKQVIVAIATQYNFVKKEQYENSIDKVTSGAVNVWMGDR